MEFTRRNILALGSGAFAAASFAGMPAFASKTDDAIAKALPELLRVARNKVEALRRKLLRELIFGTTGQSSVSIARVMGLVRQYGVAILEVTSVEDQIEHDSSTRYGLVQGDALDLQNARNEVADRIARFRDRRGS